MKPEVEGAIAEIRAAFPDATVTARDDGQGGAYVIVDAPGIGTAYVTSTSWVGFRITFQYPYADTYPHFVRGDLARCDRSPLCEGLSAGHTFEERPAIQVSRRSNHLDPRTETALIKLQKVLEWLRNR
ncbi:MAG: hypothetical protein NTU91_09845 [Chloroflexi bacterium]|nr:hypothetical protein [Chloroflexota bacterium]